MAVRVRDDDHRSDELLEEHGRIVQRLGFAVAWTSGIRDGKAKMASDTGSGAWKRAAPFPDAENAAGHFRTRCRTRNPVVVASASKLVLIEIDGDDSLLDKLGLKLPKTVTAKSRRGFHRYYRPDDGCATEKIQIDETGVTHSADGYLVLPPALHPSGVVYEFIGNGSIAVLPAAVQQQLLARATATERHVEEVVVAGGKVPEGHRDRFIFLKALAMAHDGLGEDAILAAALVLAREQCEPPLPEDLVRKQVAGAVKRARTRPAANREVRIEAEQVLLGAVGDEATAPSSDPARPGVVRNSRRRLGVTKVVEVTPERLRWLVPGLVPLGTITMPAGVGGLGKSMLACQLAARLTRGELPEQGAALYVSYEDPARAVLRPRLEAAGADLSRVLVLEEGSVLPVLPDDLPELRERAIEENVRLLIIDPVAAAVSLKLDSHKDQDVRVVLSLLAALAQEAQLAVLLIAHLNKAPSADAYIRVSGSVAFYNAARSVLTVTLDPDDDECRLVAQHKANLARLAPVQRHRIEAVSYDYGGETIDTSRLVYVEDAEGVDPYGVLEHHEPKQRTKADGASTFLMSLLVDGEWHERAELERLALAAGFSDRTFKRAATALGVESDLQGFPARAHWRLPVGPNPIPNDLA